MNVLTSTGVAILGHEVAPRTTEQPGRSDLDSLGFILIILWLQFTVISALDSCLSYFLYVNEKKSFHLFKKDVFIFIFLCMSIFIHRCAWAFSSCGKQGLLLVAVHRLLIAVTSLLWNIGSWCAGVSICSAGLSSCATWAVAPWHVGSSRTRGQTGVPCIARRILHHPSTREAPHLFLS